MNVGIVGAGRMGQTLARLALRGGHRVQLANSGDADALDTIVRTLGSGASGASTSAVSRFGALCIVCTRWEQLSAVASQCRDMRGQVVVDATNNRFGPGALDVYDLDGRSSSEVVADLFRGASLVKAFNNQPIRVLAELLDAPTPATPASPALFIAGDDAGAKTLVARFVHDIGAQAIDAGDLAHGGRLMSTGGGPLAGLTRLLSLDEATALLASSRSGHAAGQVL